MDHVTLQLISSNISPLSRNKTNHLMPPHPPLFRFWKPEVMNEVAALEIIRDHSVYYKVRLASVIGVHRGGGVGVPPPP